MLDNVRKNKLLLVSCIAFVLSYFPYLIVKENRSNLMLVIGGGLLYLAVISLGEFVTRKFAGFSLIHSVKQKILLYIFVGTLGGILLDGTAQWLSKLWFYPFWGNEFYLLVFSVGFSAYYLAIIESYLAVKVLIDKVRKGKHYLTKPKKHENHLFRFVLIMSQILLFIGLIGILSTYFGTGYSFNINRAVEHKANFTFVLIFFVGVWFILDYLGYINNRNTLIKNLYHGYFDPLIAIIVASTLLLIVMETQNAPLGLWIYQNWPLQEIKIVSIPLFAFLAWPLHYIGILSLYKAISGDQTRNIYEGDKLV